MERAMLGWVVAILVVVVVVVVPGSFYLGYRGGEVADYLGWVPGLEHLVSEVIGGVAVGGVPDDCSAGCAVRPMHNLCTSMAIRLSERS
jgi:hypothetical protein